MEKYLTSQDRYITIVFCEVFRKKMLSLATFIIMRIITIFVDNRIIEVNNFNLETILIRRTNEK